MPSKGQRGAILKDHYHQHQKHLTDLTSLSPKPQLSCFRKQNEIMTVSYPAMDRLPCCTAQWSAAFLPHGNCV